MNRIFNQCPACGGPLIITECQCRACNLQMRGEFLPPQLSRLTQDQLAFIQVFLRARGNLTETERVLGVSYPTIRNKLDEINAVFDSFNSAAAQPLAHNDPLPARSEEDWRHAILQKVSDGTLSAAEANLKLQNLSEDK